MVKITTLTLPLSSIILFEKIRGENNFSKHAQCTRISPNASVQAVNIVSNRLPYNFQTKEKKALLSWNHYTTYCSRDTSNILPIPTKIYKSNMTILCSDTNYRLEPDSHLTQTTTCTRPNQVLLSSINLLIIIF